MSIRNSKVYLFFKSIGLEILSLIWHPFRGINEEPRKVALSRSAIVAAIRCSFHFIPISVTIVLAYFNLSGYFIGGSVNEGANVSQASALLMFQIAAKVMELSIVASLGSIIAAVVMRQAASSTGITLGLLGAGIKFSQLSYLWSPAYIFGGIGVKSIVQRARLMLLILLGGLLALFVGPSSALLLIPAFVDDWPAGGTGFWLFGTDASLWPDHLRLEHAGGTMCTNVSSSIIEAAPLNMSGCIWQGYTQLSEGLKDRRFDWQGNVTLNDGVVKRQLTRQQLTASGVETWALGTHLAAARISRLLADEWYVASMWSSAAKGAGSFAHYQKAVDGGGVTRVGVWLPAVRTACLRFPSFTNLTDMQSDGALPQIVEGKPEYRMEVPFFKLPEYEVNEQNDYATCINRTISIPANSSRISTQWLSSDTRYPGSSWTSNAHIVVTVPFPNFADFQSPAVFSCSVDARWTSGEIIGVGLPKTDNMIQYGEIKHKRKPSAGDGLDSSPNAFLPRRGSFWRTVALDVEWLNALTPTLSSNSSSWTTLAKSFTWAGMDNSTGLVDGSFDSLGSTIETELASTVVDGMSRIGLSQNGGNMHHISDRFKWLGLPLYAKDKNQFLLDMLRNRATMEPPTSANVANLTKLHWEMRIAGYAYGARSVPYYLALAVLFTHALVAFIYVANQLCTRRSSGAWETLEELLLLSYNSQPDESRPFRNTCAGIWRPSTHKSLVRIGVVNDARGGDEQIQLVMMDSTHVHSSNLVDDVPYGAIVEKRKTVPQNPDTSDTADSQNTSAKPGVSVQHVDQSGCARRPKCCSMNNAG